MSEPDHGTMSTAQRISDVENLVIPVRNALCSQKYKPIDYKHLCELTAAEKMTSTKIQLKIKKMEKISKINKEHMLLKQHCQVWWQEYKRLSENREKAEAEIRTLLDEGSHKYDFFLDMWDLEHKLSQERDAYQTDTVAPIWQLRENLKFWLSEMQHYLTEDLSLKYKFNLADKLRQMESVKKQWKTVLEFLNLESLALERELQDYKTKHFSSQALTHCFEEKNGLFHEVPSALLSLEFPYPDLKSLVISEYCKLANEYWSKLQEIDEQLNVIYRSTDWEEEDQWVFQTVVNQYPSDLPQRRTLYLDMLQRCLPHKSRHELVTHEKAWDHYNFIKNQRRVLILNWTQARKVFFLKAVMAVAEASAAQEAEAVSASNRRKQQEICAELKAKILQWRAQQEEAAELEAAVAARRKEKEDEKERLQKEQEMIRRAQEKEKVKKYWAEKQLKWQEQEEKELQHMEELRKLMAKQAIKDRERVKFRQALLEKRFLEKKEQALREARAAEVKEKCLEALRQKVSVVAKPDPVRVVADTTASKARMGVGTTEEFVLQKPLFELHTYSEEQVLMGRVSSRPREADSDSLLPKGGAAGEDAGVPASKAQLQSSAGCTPPQLAQAACPLLLTHSAFCSQSGDVTFFSYTEGNADSI
ncbi:coiled-coil domain-containing protein 148 isoform X1 [Numida meleagris]|uniref:coiled-coil domain-containing protein 148 isoform X1 n=1 Tax=Numida meleagris TaxID=8996 RepID=UPI000B3E2C35|nr:coiled-coil domain-containing protein 148 isoform X1 [Numida meleagris]